MAFAMRLVLPPAVEVLRLALLPGVPRLAAECSFLPAQVINEHSGLIVALSGHKALI